MSIKIEDGTGTGATTKVNAKNRLDVSAASFSEAHLVSALDAQTYVWSTSYSASTGNEVLYIKNTSKTKKLIIAEITVGGVLTGLFELFQVTGTASGTSITGKNINLSSSNTADATALGDASVTGLTIGDRIALVRTPANTHCKIDLQDALILGLNNAIAITYTGSTNTVDGYLLGYYEDESEI
jgi:hypothetical protein